ncbi:MAG: hypothetical protein JWL62_3240 [Hyphomicrobiales bacterium]|nr:hypothetical protein [Hyphomicrobiales bacterium]
MSTGGAHVRQNLTAGRLDACVVQVVVHVGALKVETTIDRASPAAYASRARQPRGCPRRSVALGTCEFVYAPLEFETVNSLLRSF